METITLFRIAIIIAVLLPQNAVSLGSKPPPIKRIIQVTDDPGIDSAPSWSPDGKTIAFHSNRSGEFAIYAVPAEGGEAKRITEGPGHQVQPCYSPDGLFLAFVGIPPDVELYKYEDVFLFRIGADFGSRYNFTNHPGYDALPSWAPDNSRIAFISTRETTPPYEAEHIWIQRWPKGEITRITDDNTDVQQSPAWSPDGLEIAYHGWILNGAHNVDIICVDIASGERENITNTPEAQEFSPSWSPDGEYIAFDKNPPPPNPNRDIYILPRAGGEPTRLTTDPAIDDTPKWSPTGDRIAFVSTRTGNSDIFVIELNPLTP